MEEEQFVILPHLERPNARRAREKPEAASAARSEIRARFYRAI